MSDKNAGHSTTLDSSIAADASREPVASDVSKPGYFRRYRLPLLLAVVAVCLYATSILYILYGRGQVA